jgi:alkylation response protein AidB-like acyl-CoA dehydrogenase
MSFHSSHPEERSMTVATLKALPQEPADQAPTPPPDYATLAARFRPIFADIAAGAVAREQARELPFSEIERLAQAGFGALRVPVDQGGSGASIRDTFRLLIELGAADSNLVQALRAHFAFVESRLNEEDHAANEWWFRRIATGELVGAAMAERTAGTDTIVSIRPDGDGWRLSGEKYYCTGTLYADWIHVAAGHEDERLGVVVSATSEGVTRIDDWDGFGQRLTASGTTRFENVRVEPENILRRWKKGEYRADTYITAFFQQFHLAAFAGIGRAALRDAVAFVQAKTRTFGVPGTTDVAADPLVQRVIGKLSSLSFGLDAIVDGVSDALEQAHMAWLDGARDDASFLSADIKAYQGQQLAIDLVLQATSLLFEVGGASATQESRRLDRHWRNARVIASHNPAIQRERALGEYWLLGTSPRKAWAERFAAAQTAAGTEGVS